jgi:predicted nucleic acid-binding protein
MLPIDGVTRQGQPSDGVGAGPVRSGPATRVILDTNTVLDWLVFGDASAAAVGAAIEQGHLQWLVTPRMLDELRAVLAAPLALRWEASRELALTIDVTGLAIVCAEPAADNQRLLCRDATDQVFIDLACEHRPAVLLTRDRALLALRRRAARCGVDVSTAASWRPRLDAAAT